MKPISIAAQVCTKAQPPVMATSPASAPLPAHGGWKGGKENGRARQVVGRCSNTTQQYPFTGTRLFPAFAIHTASHPPTHHPHHTPAMMRSHTTTPMVIYSCNMDTSSVEMVAAAADMVVLTAMAAEMAEKPTRGPRMALVDPGLNPAAGAGHTNGRVGYTHSERMDGFGRPRIQSASQRGCIKQASKCKCVWCHPAPACRRRRQTHHTSQTRGGTLPAG